MASEEIKLFTVSGFSRNSGISRMLNYSDDYGEAFPFTKHVAATSSEEAIARVRGGFEERVRRHKKVIEKAKEIEKERGRPLDAFDLFALGIGPLPPSIPCKLEGWKAQEVKIPGYHIVLEAVTE